MQERDQEQQEQQEPHSKVKLGSVGETIQQIQRRFSNIFRKPRETKTGSDAFIFVDRPDQWFYWVYSPTKISLSSKSSTLATSSAIMDGSTDRIFGGWTSKSQGPANISAIFVHAGAGYHSITNEHIHLGACNDAARVAMRILKSGGSAVDAVEAAIKVLEDKEITNAGYGSNLSIDGVVECDATIVDHLGRSGACGATAQIRNPINLARAILEMSSKPLSLRRVPPNLLVGQGATDFAWEHGIPVVPHDMIVSRNARDRFMRWKDDLRRAEGSRLTPGSTSIVSSQGGDDQGLDLEYEERVRNKQRRDHTIAILNGTWNEGQPDSPQPSPPVRETFTQDLRYPSTHRSPSPSPQYSDRPYVSVASPSRSFSRSTTSPPSKRTRYASHPVDAQIHTPSLLGQGTTGGHDAHRISPDVSQAKAEVPTPTLERPGSSDGPASPAGSAESNLVVPPLAFSQEGTAESPSKVFVQEADEDLITDTVGAIAIDMFGHVAAGSSSGGIGMKHRGRVGPAALVGIGTAVIPADPKDESHTSVAAVTSGTGEHMATSMASQKCAERLYHNTRRAMGGTDIAATEEEAMDSFVQSDFMGHPGVRASNSTGAIGVMAVKKSTSGYILYFAHNTDSFAIASMHSNEKDAKCVMSRMGEHSPVVHGARKIRLD